MNRDQAHDDLRFVRAIVEDADRTSSPAAIYFLWAVVGLVGFALVDFREAWVSRYWSVAGPAGFLVSAILGWRCARRTGQLTSAVGRRHLLHWGGMLAAVFLAILMPISGLLSQEALAPAMLLILALGYFQAGVHLDRTFLWVGLLMGAGYVLVVLVAPYAWTVVGLGMAIALSIAGLRGGRLHEASA